MTDLTICPREDCTATYRHWHSLRGAVRVCRFLPGSCGHDDPPGVAEACHEPRPQTDLTEPVDLPTAEELAKVMYRAIYGPPILTDPFAAASRDARRRYLAASEAALALIRERLTPVEWQPIDFADIKPGMRVRKETPAVDARLTVTSIGSIGSVCAKGSWAYDSSGAVWSVDPRTIPAEPEDPRVERAAKALYEAERDSTRPGWQDVTDKTRAKYRRRARAAVAAIDEAVKSDD